MILQNAFQIAYFLWTWVRKEPILYDIQYFLLFFSLEILIFLRMFFFYIFDLFKKMQYEFKITSCFHENLPLIVIRVVLGVALQVLCSYITFPLYALVTQVKLSTTD